ncbi:MAG: dCTP deaminase [Thermoprotei archaeon]|nr:MAG: dCTP deaminase [Thermoprotei archaeon]
MILSDFDLRNYINSRRLHVEPFDESIVRENGLDLRLGEGYCLIRETDEVLDIEKCDDITKYYSCGKAEDGYIYLEKNSRYLLHTIEYLKVPPELMGFVELRSTFARLGLSIPPTIIDGGFEGQLTIELITTSFPARIRVGTRFLHVVFAKVTTPIERPYRGRYLGQRGVTLPKL